MFNPDVQVPPKVDLYYEDVGNPFLKLYNRIIVVILIMWEMSQSNFNNYHLTYDEHTDNFKMVVVPYCHFEYQKNLTVNLYDLLLYGNQ